MAVDPVPVEDNKALSLLNHIKSINKELVFIKGKAWITLKDGEQKTRFRAVWAATLPDKIRMTLLASGLPVETLVADGKTVTLLSHTGSHSTKRINSANPSLKKITGIGIKLTDFIALTAGRPPISKQVYPKELLTDERQTILLLRKKWGGSSEKIIVDPNNNVTTYQRLNAQNKAFYTVSFLKPTRIEKYELPFKTIIKDHQDRVVIFETTDFQTDIPIKETVYSLTEPR